VQKFGTPVVPGAGSDAEVAQADGGVVLEVAGRRLVLDHALLDEIHALRRLEGEPRVLLDEEDGDALAFRSAKRTVTCFRSSSSAVYEHGVEQLARLLGVAVGEQLHRRQDLLG
jgi:hypothetical protein